MYTLLIVVLGFVLFNAVDLQQALSDIGGMFGFANIPLVNAQTLYFLKSYGLLFVIALIGATPVVKQAASKLEETKLGRVLETVLVIALLLVCTAYLVDGSFNPFLYFRF